MATTKTLGPIWTTLTTNRLEQRVLVVVVLVVVVVVVVVLVVLVELQLRIEFDAQLMHLIFLMMLFVVL